MTRRARIHPAASPLRVRIHFAATLFRVRTHLAVPLLLAIAIFSCAAGLCADNTDQAGWQRQEVNWRVSGGSRVKAIHHPADQMPPTRLGRATPQARPTSQPVSAEQAAGHSALAVQDQGAPIIATVVDSPPVDGFVPWIVVSVTYARETYGNGIFQATATSSITGSFLTTDPANDYTVGLLDTGAGASIMGYEAATRTGIFNYQLVTDNPIEIIGVTGSVTATVSHPLGLFMDGIGAPEPNGVLSDHSGFVGETNVAIVVGDVPEPCQPDLPTAIGSPVAVYFAAEIRNDQVVTLPHEGEFFRGPDIHFYDIEDPCVPTYPNVIPLELRPLGSVDVQYTYDPFAGDIFDPDYSPNNPSIIIGNLSQSLFFVSSVDMTNGDKSAIDKDRFMLDTGAQVTVVGSRVGARLGLDHNNPDFLVEIQGVSGGVSFEKGFYIDTIDIPALGQWLSLTNVPIVLLDVASPEGGTLDGIIGMNLFLEFNLVVHGGGLSGQDDPSLQFEVADIPLTGDIAPQELDGIVNLLDLAAFAQGFLAPSTVHPKWNPRCDLAPPTNPDGMVNLLDFAVFAANWLEQTVP